MRSPTAEHIFADWPNVETASAGINHDADNPVTPELLEWADTVFVMESAHRSKLSAKFKRHLSGVKVICLGIPDDFAYMDDGLIALLMATIPRHLPSR